MRILFATDFDGTLMSKEPVDDGVVVSETIWGKSYMSKRNLEKLKKLSEIVDILPITARSLESYRTVNLGISPKYAIIEGGAILLENRYIDLKWKEETDNIFRSRGLMYGMKVLEDAGYACKNKAYYTLDYVNREILEAENLEMVCQLSRVSGGIGGGFDVFKNGKHGIFVQQKKLGKEDALLRFLEREHYDMIICAGDSETDYGMLHLPYILTNAESIGYRKSPANHIFKTNGEEKTTHDFAEFVLNTATMIARFALDENNS